MEVRKDHWKVKGNFWEVAESWEDFLKVERVYHGFRQRIRSHFRGRWNNRLQVLSCLFLFCSVAVRCCLAWFWVRKWVIPKRLQKSRTLEKMTAINRTTSTYRTLTYFVCYYHMISKQITLVIRSLVKLLIQQGKVINLTKIHEHICFQLWAPMWNEDWNDEFHSIHCLDRF